MRYRDLPRYIVAMGFFTWAFFAPWGVTGAEIGIAISLFGAILDIFFNRDVLKPKLSWIPVFLFLLWALRSSVSGEPVKLANYQSMWIFFMFFVSSAYFDGKISSKSVLTLFLLSLSVCAIYTIVQHYTGLDLMHHAKGTKMLKQIGNGGYQVIGTYSHHLTLANVMLLGSVLAFGRALEKVRRARLFWLISGLLMTCATLFTFAHGPLAGFLAGIFVLAVLVAPRRALPVLAGVGALSILLLATSSNFRFFIFQKWSEHVHVERLYLWKASLQLIRENPLFGVGAGNFRAQVTPLLKHAHIYLTSRAHAHNSFLQYAVEFGLVGAGLIIWFFGLLLVRGTKKIIELKTNENRGYLELAGYVAAISGLLVSGLTQHVLGDSEVAIICWLLCGIISAKSEEPLKSVSSK